eukprot:CCRYP_001926-RA/>CCRYP_001926-RA protein AED:0.43 eAED:0.43 QI:150/1/1/1/0.5/0.33/3/1152/278
MKLIIVFLSSLSMTSAFTTPSATSRHAATITSKSALSPFEQPRRNRGNIAVEMATSGDGEGGGTKKRRKRKDGKQFTSNTDANPETTTAANDAVEDTTVPIQPKQNTVVMQVRDIRDVLSGVESAPSSSREEVLQDDEEWEYYEEDEEDSKASNPDRTKMGRTQDDSMEQLLADARRMRASTAGTGDDGVQSTNEKGKAMSDTFFEVVSTIVTIDFFVVIALLVWFLAGIFCSSVLKNDAVQIAFNMNFERVTQPALGILMIGSVAGALGKKDDEEEG